MQLGKTKCKNNIKRNYAADRNYPTCIQYQNLVISIADKSQNLYIITKYSHQRLHFKVLMCININLKMQQIFYTFILDSFKYTKHKQ